MPIRSRVFVALLPLLVIAGTLAAAPASASAPVLASANAVAAPPPAFSPSVTRIEESASAIAYSGQWRGMTGGDSGGASAYLNTAGDATLRFRGSGVDWLSRTTPNSGIAQVYLDGALVATVDRYSAVTKYQHAVYSVAGLPVGDHTLRIVRTGRANPAATGANLLIDAFVVTMSNPAPTTPVVTPLADGYALSWGAVIGVKVTGYQIVRTDSSGASTVVGTVSASAVGYRDRTATVGADYLYRVKPLGDNAQLRPSPDVSTATVAPLSAAIAQTSSCPATTVPVTTAAELTAALAAPAPGTVIGLAPGTYVGEFKLRAVSGGTRGIWICGPPTATLTTGSAADGSALLINGVENVTVYGLTIQNSLKGVSILQSRNVMLRNLTVTDIGYEAIHFRTQTTDSYLVGSRIARTGLIEAKYGEGVYVGTSSANVCSQNDCKPDRTDGIRVIDNVIRDTKAQPIEAKEGTASGDILSNDVSGTAGMDEASTGLVLVKGNGWRVANNDANVVSGAGLAVIFSPGGVGNDNVFAGNRVTGSASYAVWVHPASFPVSGPTVLCSNRADSAPTSNVDCVR